MGLTESVTILVLNSLTVIAFYRNRYLRKRSTYLVISLAVADMLSGVISPLDLFYNIGVTCNFWRHNAEIWYQIPVVATFWFLGCSLTNMTVISLERLNATFWPFRHRTMKKSVYWVLIIAVWLTALLIPCALIINYHYAHKQNYPFFTTLFRLDRFYRFALIRFTFFYRFAGFRFCQRKKFSSLDVVIVILISLCNSALSHYVSK